MKRIIKLLSIIILIGMVISLVSCGKKSSGGEETPSDSGLVEVGDRVVVYDVEYNFNNKNLDEKISNVQNKVSEVGGYVKESNRKDDKATYIYKVPTAKLDTLVSYLDTLGGLINKDIQSEDITTEYNSLSAALETIDARIAINKFQPLT